jgi:multidrug resistance efflux pump
MDQRVQLATARVKLELAEADLKRDEELFRDKIVSQQILDAARTARDALQTEIKERSTLVAEQEERLKSLNLGTNGVAYPSDTTPEDVLRASIKVQEEKLRLTEAELRPITLTVDMEGTVSAVHHRSGEAVLAGEPIVTLTAINSDRIIGYVRQPISFEPKVGQRVEVRARSLRRCVGEAEIVEVGAHMEPISAALSPLSNAHIHEVGLPVLVSVPRSQKLLPGEIVDLRILPGREESLIRPANNSTLR